MTTGVLSPDVVIDGNIYADLHSFHTSDINDQMDLQSATVHGRTTFYAQWALHYAGTYAGKVNGLVGTNTALYDAFVSAYDQGYAAPFVRPSGGHVSFKFFQAIINDWSSVDINIYKVID